MKHFFTSKLFPTSTLFELHSNNYQTVEERSLTRQLKDAKRNFLIAIIGLGLSLLMPIFLYLHLINMVILLLKNYNMKKS